jgi:hypothetical protein
MQEHVAANAELNEYLATMNENFQRQRPLEAGTREGVFSEGSWRDRRAKSTQPMRLLPEPTSEGESAHSMLSFASLARARGLIRGIHTP